MEALPHLVDFPLLCAHKEHVVNHFVEVKGGATPLGEEGTALDPFWEEGSQYLLYPGGPPGKA